MNDTPELRHRIFSLFPFLAKAGRDAQAELFKYGTLVRHPPERLLCLEGEKCSCVPLVLSGQARVYKIGESGREITLYRVGPGESCIMAASCILSDFRFPAFSATETSVEAVVISPEVLHQFVNRFQIWREYLCGMLASRLAEVITVLEAVAFRRMDTRMAEYLLHRAHEGDTIKRTHQEIAIDLGTSREVVSRVLEEFEREGLIVLSRGEIRTEDVKGLGRFSYHVA